MKTRIKLNDIPKFNSGDRKRISRNLTTSEGYLRDIENGLPFFTEEQLKDIEETYCDGMTKEDIMGIIFKRGWQIKESTITSYIQKKLIPGSIRREKTKKGMISIYPPDTIRHLNFVRYSLFSKGAIATIINMFKTLRTQTDREVLEMSIIDPVFDDCLDVIQDNISSNIDRLSSVRDGIERAFAEDKKKRDLYLKMVDELEKLNESLWEKYESFLNKIEENTSERTEVPQTEIQWLINYFSTQDADEGAGDKPVIKT